MDIGWREQYKAYEISQYLRLSLMLCSVGKRARGTNKYIFGYKKKVVCVCVCACMRERGRELLDFFHLKDFCRKQ